MEEDFVSPVDLPGRHHGKNRPLRWTTVTIAVTTLFLLATNAVALRGWVDELRPSPMQARASLLAAHWQMFTDDLGLGAPRAWLNARWKKAQAARYGAARPNEVQR